MSNYQSSYGKNIDHTKATREDYDAHVRQEIEKMFDRVENVLANDHVAPLKQAVIENQKAVDDLLSEYKNGSKQFTNGKKTFGEAFTEAITNKFKSDPGEFEEFTKDRHAKLKLELKAVGNMTIGANLTGDSVQTYSGNQGIIPAQAINFRDLIPTTISSTGQFVHYRESAGEGSIGNQTEGSAKAQIDFDLTEVKTVNRYISGFTRFSKQLMKSLPFFQGLLPRLLLREFYEQENSHFKGTFAAACSGYTTTSETDDVKQLIDVLSGRADQNFQNSFIICKNSQVGNLLKLLYNNGYYSGSGSVVGTPNGQVFIGGVPVIGVSWMTSGYVGVIDRDYIERVEAESLRVEFSYEDSDNFQKNLVTARVECYEELNVVRGDAHSWFQI